MPNEPDPTAPVTVLFTREFKGCMLKVEVRL